MKLEGIHHITAITGDAPRNLDFYTRVMGLRLVKKTVNQDQPTIYHLFYADDAGSPGADLTFFEYPGAAPGRDGAGMVHRIVSRVGSPEAVDFWAARLAEEGLETERGGDTLRFADPEGLGHELVVDDTGDPPLIAERPDIPTDHALRGFHSVRAYSADPEASRPLLEALEFERKSGDTWEARGEERGGMIAYDEPPAEAGRAGGGTVHHVAWSAGMDEQPVWRERASEGGAHPTDVIDRFWFRSIYFREPSGVLFEIATRGPGFTADEELEHLGEKLVLPPKFEPMRERIERELTPL